VISRVVGNEASLAESADDPMYAQALCADEVGEINLRDAKGNEDFSARTFLAVPAGEEHKLPGNARPDFERSQRVNMLIRDTESVCQDLCNIMGKGRHLLEKSLELRVLQIQQHAVGHRDHASRVRSFVDQTYLAHDLAGPKDRENSVSVSRLPKILQLNFDHALVDNVDASIAQVAALPDWCGLANDNIASQYLADTEG